MMMKSLSRPSGSTLPLLSRPRPPCCCPSGRYRAAASSKISVYRTSSFWGESQRIDYTQTRPPQAGRGAKEKEASSNPIAPAPVDQGHVLTPREALLGALLAFALGVAFHAHCSLALPLMAAKGLVSTATFLSVTPFINTAPLRSFLRTYVDFIAGWILILFPFVASALCGVLASSVPAVHSMFDLPSIVPGLVASLWFLTAHAVLKRPTRASTTAPGNASGSSPQLPEALINYCKLRFQPTLSFKHSNNNNNSKRHLD